MTKYFKVSIFVLQPPQQPFWAQHDGLHRPLPAAAHVGRAGDQLQAHVFREHYLKFGTKQNHELQKSSTISMALNWELLFSD